MNFLEKERLFWSASRIREWTEHETEVLKKIQSKMDSKYLQFCLESKQNDSGKKLYSASDFWIFELGPILKKEIEIKEAELKRWTDIQNERFDTLTEQEISRSD
ncbi:MAG: hypothetical protein Q4P17_04015 [Methanobacterium sp.]|nr:hypothetical protein [Methanobacterium sp.]